MDIATTKLELMRQLMSIMDEATLQRVANFFKKEVPAAVEEDITDEEAAEFDKAIARHESGEEKFHSEEGSMRMVRSGRKA